MKLSRQAIDRPRVVIVGVLIVMLVAALAAFYIPVQRTPAINTAVILVMVPYPGAQPTEVEDKITRKIEDALKGLNNVDFIASTSMRGSSITQIIFLDGVEAKRARDDVAAKTGIDEVGIPVIAADLTTMAAFLPMLLVPGIMGDFMGVMPKVVTAALLGSVVVDHFLIPVLAAYWYRQGTPPAEAATTKAPDGPSNGSVAIHPDARVRRAGPSSGNR